MEISNLSTNPSLLTEAPVPQKKFNLWLLVIVLSLGLTSGFFLSRLYPAHPSGKQSGAGLVSNGKVTSGEDIKSKEDLEVGKLYGNLEKKFSDTATGTIEAGNINGEGTHILNREGGITQRASLTSSSVDLDLFVGHKVEVRGETNVSNKTSWLLDVFTIKILE